NSSTNWARAETARLLPSYATNYGNLNRSDKLYMLSETFGFQTAVDRTKNAGYNKGIKMIADSPFGIMNILASPHNNTIMLSILDDLRIHEGRFFTYNQFKVRSDMHKLNKNQILAKWNSLKENSLYNLLESKDGIMSLSDKG